MDSLAVKEIFESKVDSIFSFSFALLPDELFAQQLILDSLSQVLCSKLDIILGESEFLVELFGAMYRLAVRRSSHISVDLTPKNDLEETFFTFPISWRVNILLHDRFAFSFHQIAYVLATEVEVVQAEYLKANKFLQRGERVEAML